MVENALWVAAQNGNITACIFWLKNRRPGKWRDRPQEYGSEQQEDDNLYTAITEAVKQP